MSPVTRSKYPPSPSFPLLTYSKAEDRLDLISADFYGDSTLWWVIAMANDVPGDSMFITPGFQLRIPNNVTTALDEYDDYNTNN